MARTTRGIATLFGWTIGVVSAVMAVAMAQTPAAAQDGRPHGLRFRYRAASGGDGDDAQHGAGPAGAQDDRRPAEGACGDRAAVDREVPADPAAPRQHGRRQVRGGPRRHFQGGHGGDRGESEARAAAATGTDPDPAMGRSPSPASERAPAAMAYAGPSLAERLKLSDDQVKRIRTIVEEGRPGDYQGAAPYPILVDPKDKPIQRGRRSASWWKAPNSRRAREGARAGRESPGLR